MEVSIFNSFSRAINSCFVWFENIFSKLPNIYNLLICVIILITIYRFLLSPLFKGGVGSSDKVKNDKKNDSKGGDK